MQDTGETFIMPSHEYFSNMLLLPEAQHILDNVLNQGESSPYFLPHKLKDGEIELDFGLAGILEPYGERRTPFHTTAIDQLQFDTDIRLTDFTTPPCGSGLPSEMKFYVVGALEALDVYDEEVRRVGLPSLNSAGSDGVVLAYGLRPPRVASRCMGDGYQAQMQIVDVIGDNVAKLLNFVPCEITNRQALPILGPLLQSPCGEIVGANDNVRNADEYNDNICRFLAENLTLAMEDRDIMVGITGSLSFYGSRSHPINICMIADSITLLGCTPPLMLV
ncbi:hypothetical protein CVT24_000307 [Panaeolus cyanescens]|uniref:Uncharacterized protein n=1 Tax=Panaeolus cyanescens TaxID=181874 RepID=A0A409YCV8_9AGAR|nr:hypothetical protein CVT24_000307 [Panaeolus cyanescens]